MRCFCLLTLVAGVTASSLDAADPSQNAALRYWHAFDALGKLEPAPGEYLDPKHPKPLDDEARKLLDGRKTSLLYLRRGASQPYCEWGLHLEDGPGLFLPHIQKSRDLSWVSCLSVRRHFEEGRPAEAVDDLMATLTMARHLGTDQTLIAMLVQFAIERLAYQTAAPYLTQLDAKGLAALSERLAKLPASANVRSSIELENEHMIGWLMKRIKEHMKPGDIAKIMGDESSYAAIFEKEGEAGALRHLEALQKDYDALAKALTLPRAQQDATVEELRKKMEANPFGRLLMPAIAKVRAAEDKIAVHRALFRAAIVLAQGGEAEAKKIKDPAGDGPFEIHQLARGYELRSKLTDKDEPISLRVGTAKK